MLNRFKIGIKLTAGFLFILFLLTIVAFVSYKGILSVQSNMDMELVTNDILSDMIQIRGNLSTALLASARGELSGDTQHKERRIKCDDYIKRTADKIYNSLTPENQKNLDAVLTIYNKYAETDNKWYAVDNEQNIINKQLRQNAETIFKKLEEFTEQVRQLMIAEKRIDNGVEYYKKLRYEQTVDVDRAVFLMQTLRCDLYKLLASKGRKEFEVIGDDIVKKTAPELQKNLTIIKSITPPDDQKNIDEIFTILNQWIDNFNKTLEYLNEKDDIAERQAKYSDEMEKIIENMLDIVTKYAASVGQNADRTVQSILIMIAISAGTALAFGFGISYLLSRNITSGLKVAMNAINKVVLDGDLSAEITSDIIYRKDEIGDMSRVAESVLYDYRTIDAMANALATGDWRVTVKTKSTLDTMNQNLGKMLDQVNNALAEIHIGVKKVTDNANSVSSASQTLSCGVQESSSSLEQIAASMSQISGQTKANAKRALEASDIANNTTKAATEGQTAMKKMNDAMTRITKNSEEIQRVIKVIDDIAFQTNLLALNAAVEAARAGAHGKGFAVVAEEVRNLAARSAKAARETSTLISTSGRDIEIGGKVAEHTSNVLNEIVEQVKETANLVGEIATASNEQAQGVAQVSIGLNQIDAVTQQNTAAAEESANSANTMNNMATTLQNLVEKFKLRKTENI
ncbi:MAG: methyl-accepting chemotaxis protein [Planctomycetaceae bacterium]|jgi:methyl-accepting chemotaxis protein|nr:methyl-accepting chemotaxis protein [Planctomycetaceae bacterium]